MYAVAVSKIIIPLDLGPSQQGSSTELWVWDVLLNLLVAGRPYIVRSCLYYLQKGWTKARTQETRERPVGLERNTEALAEEASSIAVRGCFHLFPGSRYLFSACPNSDNRLEENNALTGNLASRGDTWLILETIAPSLTE